jgi:hypothetical protein
MSERAAKKHNRSRADRTGSGKVRVRFSCYGLTVPAIGKLPY